MIVNASEFVEIVRALYAGNPSYISSIPFWKLERFLLESLTYRIVDGGHTCLYAVKDDRLLFYWSDTQDRFLLPSQAVLDFSFMVLHEDFYRLVERDLTDVNQGDSGSAACSPCTATPSYTLFYDFSYEDPRRANPGYYTADFDFHSEDHYADAARVINDTDESYHVTPDTVKQWTEVSAFDPALWIWIREDGTDLPVGIGVSNYNPEMHETDLDWVFVLPAHQGKGVGRMLVRETIDRSRSRSGVIRLGGVADGFYMKCGFQRRDKWYVIRK